MKDISPIKVSINEENDGTTQDDIIQSRKNCRL